MCLQNSLGGGGGGRAGPFLARSLSTHVSRFQKEIAGYFPYFVVIGLLSVFLCLLLAFMGWFVTCEFGTSFVILTLVLLNLNLSYFENNVDSDQVSSDKAI